MSGVPRPAVRWIFSLLLVVIPGVSGAEEAGEQNRALSPRNANYAIDVRLDPGSKTLEGRQVLTWRNVQELPTAELRYHLYWNAWRNSRSTWMLEDRLRGRSDRRDDIREEDWGYVEVGSVRLLDGEGEGAEGIDLTGRQRFDSPDDGNPDDRTVLVVELPRPVRPGETIRVEMTWRAKVPRTFARTGYRGDYFFIAQWFPKLGVFEPTGWNCHQFHASTEFYSDYGVYDVRITAPAGFVLGATGRETDRRENPDGTMTWRYQQEDVHDFSWTASPDYLVREARFEEPGLPPVEMRLLFQPEHRDQVERHFAAAGAALKYYGSWFGPYPYGHVTLVDPAYGSGAGGMEYPTLFTCGTRLFNPFGGDSPESVTVHEAGHQFWYGLVGNNEFEYAWLDEGLNSYSQLKTLDAAYPQKVLVRRYLPSPGQTRVGRGFLPYHFAEIEVPRFGRRLDAYRRSATANIQSGWTFGYFPPSAHDTTYSKTTLWLATLERHLGWETVRQILSTFFQRYAFRHPTPEDFFAVANEISGQDLGWFFDQVYRGSDSFDYAIDSVASFPSAPEGWVEADGELAYVHPEPDDTAVVEMYRTEVVVRRLGGAQFPVAILLVFEDGHELRESWDGRDRWKLVTVERPAKLEYAAVDPERVLLLDIDYTNNTRLLEPASGLPARKWGSKWMIWLQDLLATFEFFL